MTRISHTRTQQSSEVILQLLSNHQRFHSFLDKLALKTEDAEIIAALIEIRRVNIECITKYTDLLANNTNISAQVSTAGISRMYSGTDKEDMTMWNIHGQLARFMPVYRKLLRSPKLSKVQRMIIAQIHDKLIALKEQLLHPVNELVLEDHGASLV